MPLIANDVLTCAAGAAPDRLAVTLGDEAMTFGEVQSSANRLSHALLGAGGAPGERMAWWSEISLRGVGLFFAASRIGLAFVPLNPASSDDEVTAALAYLRPQFLVVDPAHAERAEQLVSGHDTRLVTVGGAPASDGRSAPPGLDLDALADADAAVRPPLPTCRSPTRTPSAPSS